MDEIKLDNDAALAAYNAMVSAASEGKTIESQMTAAIKTYLGAISSSEALKPLALLDPADDEAANWVTGNLTAIRRDNGNMDYSLTAVVRAFQAGRASAVCEQQPPAQKSEADGKAREALEKVKAGIDASVWHDVHGEKMKRVLFAQTAIDRIDSALFALSGNDTNDRERAQEIGAKTQALVRRDGCNLTLEWARFGEHFKLRVYEPHGIEITPAIADLLANAVDAKPNIT